MQTIQSNGTVILNNPFTNEVSVLFFYPVKPNQTYTVSGTNDGINYTPLYTFSTGPSQNTISHTVSDVCAGPWPKLTQN